MAIDFNFAPYQWRADQGYLPPPDSMPLPVYPPPFPPQWYYPPPPAPFPPPAYLAIPPPPAPASKPKSELPTPPKIDKSITDLKSVAPGESSCGTVSHFAAKSTKSTGAPSLKPGINYLFPPKDSHTLLHVFNKSSPKIWTGGYKGQQLEFKIFKVATNFPVALVIERVLAGKAEAKRWAVTEVVERGGGEWLKGTTIPYDSDKAKGSLAEMGWGGKRGGDLPPVWVVVHKV